MPRYKLSPEERAAEQERKVNYTKEFKIQAIEWMSRPAVQFKNRETILNFV